MKGADMPKISFNGQEYDDPDQMPPEVRQLYDFALGMVAATNKGELPDAFQQAQATVMSASQFMIDGKVYGSLAELPPELREKYEHAMQPFDKNQNGIPDMLEDGRLGISQVQPFTKTADPAVQVSPPSLVRVIGEESKTPNTLIIAGLVIVVLLGVIAFLVLSR
jgi:hypothetical protein